MERPTLLRIKRRLDEDALDVVVLHQSKIRRESTDGPGATDKPDKLFRLMGTLPVALARDKACAEDLLVRICPPQARLKLRERTRESALLRERAHYCALLISSYLCLCLLLLRLLLRTVHIIVVFVFVLKHAGLSTVSERFIASPTQQT
eukprot:Opistho-2@28903